ncbi:MAG: ABC transporter substrate-binding protein [Eubacteriales bacterium]|nr:ABC transporter substrate-binding protein [Eubacteriales bacterium]
MKLNQLGGMALAAMLALTNTTGALAAKNEKIDAATIDFSAVIEDTAEKGTVNVYHWWTAGGEKDAIESVIAGFKSAYPEEKAKSNAIPGGAGGAMVMKVKVLQQAGKSPEAFQAHPGQEIQPYLDANMLLDLSSLWDYAGLNDRVIASLKELCTASDGKQYIVPIGIHKTNVIFYNIHVFEKYGIAIPDHEDITWDEFWSLCDQLAAAMPDGEYPIDLGDRKGWPACQVFEDIMMGTSPQIYEDFINGSYNVDDVTEVMSTYARLLDYVAPDHSSRDWYEASGQVVAGTYAMQIMGAWMQPLLTSMGQVYGEDYGVFTFPGTEGWFGLCVDGFVVSNDSADVNAGIRWAYNVSTKSVQESFSALKESISPYTDTDDSIYCPLTLRFKEQMNSDSVKTYPSFTHGTALPWSASTSLQTQIQEFATSSDHDAEYFANKIVNILKEAGVKGEWQLVD